MTDADVTTISISPEIAEALRESVAAGEYRSTGDALRDAVRIWRRERAERAERLEAIKARIQKSIEDPRPPLSAEEMLEWLDGLEEDDRPAERREAS